MDFPSAFLLLSFLPILEQQQHLLLMKIKPIRPKSPHPTPLSCPSPSIASTTTFSPDISDDFEMTETTSDGAPVGLMGSKYAHTAQHLMTLVNDIRATGAALDVE